MINLQTDNPLLLKAREDAKKYLISEVLNDSPLAPVLIDDLINMTESALNSEKLNAKGINFVYSRIYNSNLKNALPEHMLKGNNPNGGVNTLKEDMEKIIASNSPNNNHLKIVK